MPQYRLPEMSIAQMQYNPATFQGVNITPQAPDMNILARSLAQAEERENRAIEQEAKFNENATKLESLVNPSEQEWVKDYISKQQETFQENIKSGNFGAAIRNAIKAGSQLLKRPEAVGRIKNAEAIKSYKETLQKKVDAGLVSSDIAKAWEIDNQNSFKSTDIINDKTGEIIGVNEWKPNWKPVNYVDTPTKIQEIFKGISPERGGSSSTTGKYNDKETTQRGSQKDYQRVTKERFIPVLRERFMEDDAWRNYIIQEQMSAKILLDNVNEQIEKETDPIKLNALKASKKLYEKKAADDDGKIITDPFEFLQHKYKDTINSLPYNYITTGNTNIVNPRRSGNSGSNTKSGQTSSVIKHILDGLDNPEGEQTIG